MLYPLTNLIIIIGQLDKPCILFEVNNVLSGMIIVLIDIKLMNHNCNLQYIMCYVKYENSSYKWKTNIPRLLFVVILCE